MNKLGKLIVVLINIVGIMFLVWTTVSLVDVAVHNLSGGTDAEWNLFVKLAEQASPMK